MAELNTGTIDYGIDLGTTTSSVARVDGNTTAVIPNTLDNKNFVSSAVYIKKNGTIFVGDKAKNKIATDPKNGYTEFKLRMGSKHVYDFEATGRQMTPEELSAEILKNLKQSVKEKNNKDIKSVVITVPADFNAPQNTATRKAAELAGFEEVLLLQEPTAAAMAYGFDSSAENEIWLIYDLGGGTFDVSIMKKSSEEIQNINNHGDSHLGGKLIDWDIVDKILAPQVASELNIPDFNRANQTKYVKQFAKLKKAAENAKTDLSNFDTTEIEIENFMVMDDGDFFDFEYDMTRSQLDEIMKPYVDRTINHCHEALKDANLSINDVTKIILVGGSTLSPYIHQRLQDEFNIPLDFSNDPTTVVARGAAIYASTKTTTVIGGGEVSSSDDVNIEVLYDTMGVDEEFDVQGKIIIPNGSPEGYLVEFVNNKTHYSSGQIPVNANGVFMTELIAEDENDYNTYEIKVYDGSGNPVDLSPNSVNTIKYKIQAPPSQHILSHTYGFGKFGDQLDIIAEKQTPLPYDFENTYRTSNLVHKGNSSEKVYIPLYEGNKMKASNNDLIGSITITGDQIKRDLPADSEIELKLHIDESMEIEGTVYIPFLDQEFSSSSSGGMDQVYLDYSYEELSSKFNTQKERYNSLRSESASIVNVEIDNYFNKIVSEEMIENIERFLENSKTDPDALDNANKRINDFADILDHIEIIITRNKDYDEIKSDVDNLMGLVEQDMLTASEEIRNFFNQLKEAYNQAVASRNTELLSNIRDQLTAIVAQLHEKEMIQMAFLELSNLYRSNPGKFIDPSAAGRLIMEGDSAINMGNIEDLRRIVSQLYRILKDDPIPVTPGQPDSNRQKTDWGIK